MIPEATQLLKDADERIVPHAIWAVQQRCERLVVMSNDTYTVMRSHAMQCNPIFYLTEFDERESRATGNGDRASGRVPLTGLGGCKI